MMAFETFLTRPGPAFPFLADRGLLNINDFLFLSLSKPTIFLSKRSSYQRSRPSLWRQYWGAGFVFFPL